MGSLLCLLLFVVSLSVGESVKDASCIVRLQSGLTLQLKKITSSEFRQLQNGSVDNSHLENAALLDKLFHTLGAYHTLNSSSIVFLDRSKSPNLIVADFTNHSVIYSHINSTDVEELKCVGTALPEPEQDVAQFAANLTLRVAVAYDFRMWTKFRVYTAGQLRDGNETHEEIDRLASLEIQKHASHTIKGLRKIFKGLRSKNFEFVDVVLAKLIISKKLSQFWRDAPGYKYVIDNAYLQMALDWYRAQDNKDFDHLAIITGADLMDFRGRQGVIGLAMVGSMASDRSVSIVEERGLQTWLPVAHEMGHALGAWHDGGQGNLCLPTEKHIMSSYIDRFLPWEIEHEMSFSNCSLEYFDSFFAKFVRSSEKAFTVDKHFTNNIELMSNFTYSLDQVCQLSVSDSQGFFKQSSDSLSDPSKICQRIACHKNGGFFERPGIRAFPGTHCGDKKSCNWVGSCEADATAPAVEDEKCFFGDVGANACTVAAISIKWLPAEKEKYCVPGSAVNLYCCDTYKKLC